MGGPVNEEFASFIELVIDIERAQGGTLTVSQEPFVQLQEHIGPPTPWATLAQHPARAIAWFER